MSNKDCVLGGRLMDSKPTFSETTAEFGFSIFIDKTWPTSNSYLRLKGKHSLHTINIKNVGSPVELAIRIWQAFMAEEIGVKDAARQDTVD